MRSKKYLAILVSIAVIAGLGVVGVAGAVTTDDGDVTFTVQATMEITAADIPLGTVSAGTTSWTKQPVTVSSNVAWNVTALATDDFKDVATGTIVLSIGSLEMNSLTMQKTGGSAITIASGGVGTFTPDVSTELTIPWNRTDLVDEPMSATIDYTVAAQ